MCKLCMCVSSVVEPSPLLSLSSFVNWCSGEPHVYVVSKNTEKPGFRISQRTFMHGTGFPLFQILRNYCLLVRPPCALTQQDSLFGTCWALWGFSFPARVLRQEGTLCLTLPRFAHNVSTHMKLPTPGYATRYRNHWAIQPAVILVWQAFMYCRKRSVKKRPLACLKFGI